MPSINTFFLWFFFGLNGIGGWFLFFLAAIGATSWVFYNSFKRRLPAAVWRIGAILVVMLFVPAAMYRFTYDPTNPFFSPLIPFTEPIFYLGILGSILPIVLVIGYFITFQSFDKNSSGFMFEKSMIANQLSKSAKNIKVFLCHASEDKPAVRQLHDKLLKKRL